MSRSTGPDRIFKRRLLVPSDRGGQVILRFLILCGAVGVASVLLAAPAEASPVCQQATVSGLIYQPVGPYCAPWTGTTTCDTQVLTVGSLVTAEATVCVPR
jgi:hypothetical protein